MAYGAWRGMVGTVKPTKGSGSLEELIRMLPDGIGVIPLFNNIRHGTIGEFSGVLPSYEEKVAELAADKVDVIHPAGTPPFMLLGYRKEQELIAAWEKKYGVPIFTSGSNQVRALKALGVKKFVGIGYDFEDTSIVDRYFTDAGFKVLGLERLPGRWEDIGTAVVARSLPADQADVPEKSDRRRDLRPGRQDPHARHRRDCSSGTCRCRCCIPASRPHGRSCCGCTCASRRRDTAACWPNCRRANPKRLHPSRSILSLARFITASRACCAIRTIRA